MTWTWNLLGYVALGAAAVLVGYFMGYNQGIKHGMLISSGALDALANRVEKDETFGPPNLRRLVAATLDAAAKALRRT